MVGLNIVAMDIVELSPAYDSNGASHPRVELTSGEISAIAAADMVYDFLSILALGVTDSTQPQKVRDEL